MKTKQQLSRATALETLIQVTSVGASVWLIDLRGYPFLGNSNIPNANVLRGEIRDKQILGVR